MIDISSKERREWYKAHGICANCGCEKARPGFATCYVCKAREIEHNRQNWQRNGHKYKEKNRIHSKELYDSRKKLGMCTKCGKVQAKPGRAKCEKCLRIDSERHKKANYGKCVIPKNQFPSLGRCYNCGKSPLMPGKKQCEECYQKSLVSLKKARQAVKSGWRFQNFSFGKWQTNETGQKQTD
mgnify:CR=1 FL=1